MDTSNEKVINDFYLVKVVWFNSYEEKDETSTYIQYGTSMSNVIKDMMAGFAPEKETTSIEVTRLDTEDGECYEFSNPHLYDMLKESTII